MKVRDIMTSQVEWVGPTTSVLEVAKLMKDRDIGSIPICDNDRVLGIVTDRDIVLRGIAAGKNPSSLSVRDVMTTQVMTIASTEDAHQAADIMAKNQIRRLPVVDNGRLVGILALGDMAVERIHVNEAGSALSNISQGVHH